jgi:hypothetical protein
MASGPAVDKTTLEELDKIALEVQNKIGVKLSRHQVILYLLKFYHDKRE